VGLSLNSVGYRASKSSPELNDKEGHVIALAGNPNVGKSTVFNGLTGMKQHTGNWPGKTVVSQTGNCVYENQNYLLVDLPGTYSLMAHSREEEIARNYICFENPDLIIVVCDATSLERNLNLVLQIMEITNKVLVCVNLINEARKKHILLDLEKLESILGVPVIGINAFRKMDLKELLKKASHIINNNSYGTPKPILYSEQVEEAIKELEVLLQEFLPEHLNSRWIAMKLLEWDDTLIHSLNHYLDIDLYHYTEIINKRNRALESLHKHGITRRVCEDVMIIELLHKVETLSKSVISYQNINYDTKDRKIDRILAGKRIGFPIMVLLLLLIFWITIWGANYPSQLLFRFLFFIEDKLMELTSYLGFPKFLQGLFIQGAYRVLAWVVSVMLPPMAIFFPMFTLLEDLGYLPRIAFNLDHYFKKACACGKQSLTMCMGFGCNAAGVTGCRIIDSPRERLIAMLTNNFVPCNGRFPTILSIITMFFVTGILGTHNIPSSNYIESTANTASASSILSYNILSSLLLYPAYYRKPF
jgi:ferrous iron transport protein B